MYSVINTRQPRYMASVLQVVQCLSILDHRVLVVSYLADLTVSKRPGTSDQIEIHFAI